MKATTHFKNTIQNYLEQRAQTDAMFEWSYSTKENKNIDDCCSYILNQVKESGCNGFADEEIFSMAVHYWDEDNIDIGKPVNCHIAVNHIVELTEEEKEQAKKEALEKVHNETYSRMKQPIRKAKKVVLNTQPSLFDF
ncbi:PcfK-like family protein [Dysgonomonas sp. Marseille-P4361]|uniref:PcfK-like family protein n=1 Tax=Dysgonomonas sp. Marseille-P4361 TaxID=2161820 RepID=UPI000D558ADC|nr:PcfK-like family protein [Dysgonomonas sp. Marseille-P4361]